MKKITTDLWSLFWKQFFGSLNDNVYKNALFIEMKQKGNEIIRFKSELENAPVFSTSGRLGLFSDGNLPFSNQISSGSQQPSLSDMVRRAIEFRDPFR